MNFIKPDADELSRLRPDPLLWEQELDCRPEFVRSFAATAALALKRGVEGNPVQIRTPLVERSKADIVRLGLELRAPLELTWSCYRGGDQPCGTCDACALRAKGFAEAGVADPALV